MLEVAKIRSVTSQWWQFLYHHDRQQRVIVSYPVGSKIRRKACETWRYKRSSWRDHRCLLHPRIFRCHGLFKCFFIFVCSWSYHKYDPLWSLERNIYPKKIERWSRSDAFMEVCFDTTVSNLSFIVPVAEFVKRCATNAIEKELYVDAKVRKEVSSPPERSPCALAVSILDKKFKARRSRQNQHDWNDRGTKTAWLSPTTGTTNTDLHCNFLFRRAVA